MDILVNLCSQILKQNILVADYLESVLSSIMLRKLEGGKKIETKYEMDQLPK